MSDEEDEAVGYKRPPKQHRFEKGRSGNPKGRPRKARARPNDNSIAAILERVGNETVAVNGRDMTLLEIEIQSIQRAAAKGNIAASKHLANLRKSAGVGVALQRGGGVLVVPGVAPLEEWTLAAARQQAQFRHADYGSGQSKEKKGEEEY